MKSSSKSSAPTSGSGPTLPLSVSSVTAVAGAGIHGRRFALSNQVINLALVVILLLAALIPLIFGPSPAEIEQAVIAEANYTLSELEEEIEVDPVVASASLRSTSKLISAIVLGVLAAKYGILDHSAIDALARLAYYLFEPALMLCSVARTLNVETGGLSRRSLFLVMPLASVLHTIVGLVTAKGITTFVPMRSPSDARDLVFCVTFANSANLPLVFAASLFPLSAHMQADVTACISFYLLILCPIFYTLGVGFLQTKEEKSALQEPSSKTTPNSSYEDFVAFVNKCLNPPVIGSVLGVVVGTVPLMRAIFLEDDSIGAPLFAAVQTFGTAYLPSTILVLAGSMVAAGGAGTADDKGEIKRLPSSDHFDDAAKPRGDTTVNPNLSATSIGWITVARFIIWPVATHIMLRLFAQSSLFAGETARNQAICSFVILIQGSMPPAQNSVLLLQLAGMKKRAMRMTRMLTVLYCISIVPVTILVSQGLSATGIMKFAKE